MFLKKLNEKNSIGFLICIAVMILLIPHLVRLIGHDNSLIGFETYYHQRITEEIINQGKIDYGALSLSGLDSKYEPYYYILATISPIIGIEHLLRLLPFLLGILSLIVFYSILKKIKIKIKIRFLTGLVFVLSPIFIYFFTLSNKHAIPFFINLVGFYFFLSRKRYFIISLISFLIVSLLSLSHAIVGFLAIISYGFLNKEEKWRITFISFILFGVIFLKYIPFYSEYPLPYSPSFITLNIFNSFISDFGALIAFGLFTLLLSIIGLITIKKNYQNTVFFFLSFLLIITSYYFIHLRMYINLLFAFLVANALLIFINRQWKIKIIKNLTLLAIICGILFSTLSYVERVSNMDPSKEVISSLEWLKNQPGKIVLSHYEKGFWLETIANKSTVMNGLFDYVPNIEEKYNDSINVFTSRNLKYTSKILDKYAVDYIWIDEKMKKGQVWDKDGQGLLFILKNSERFKRVYSLDGIEIWTYIK